MTYLNQIRPVLFVFYMAETVVNLLLIHFYLDALSFIQETQVMFTSYGNWYYIYLVFFYSFTVMTLFACVNVCTKNQPSILEEVLRPLFAFFVYTILTLLALYDIEIDFPMMFPKTTNMNVTEPEEPLKSYFKLMRSQATTSLMCSVIYLLHCLIALDVLLSNEDADSEQERSSDEPGETMYTVEGDYQPVRLFVLGSHTQRWLEKHQWYRDYVNEGVMEI